MLHKHISELNKLERTNTDCFCCYKCFIHSTLFNLHRKSMEQRCYEMEA